VVPLVERIEIRRQMKARRTIRSATKIGAKKIPRSGASLEITAAAQGSPSQCPAKETTGARGPKGPAGPNKNNQGGLISEPTYPKKSCQALRHRHSRLRPVRRRLVQTIVLPHLAEEGGTPVRRACVPHYLGHTAEGNLCRMMVPPHQSSCLRRQSWWLGSSKDTQQEGGDPNLTRFDFLHQKLLIPFDI
jgi:hypothetical protein